MWVNKVHSSLKAWHWKATSNLDPFDNHQYLSFLWKHFHSLAEFQRSVIKPVLHLYYFLVMIGLVEIIVKLGARTRQILFVNWLKNCIIWNVGIQKFERDYNLLMCNFFRKWSMIIKSFRGHVDSGALLKFRKIFLNKNTCNRAVCGFRTFHSSHLRNGM